MSYVCRYLSVHAKSHKDVAITGPVHLCRGLFYLQPYNPMKYW